jgi:hypothetical protein
MPGRLRAVVCAGMEQVQAVLVEAKRAEAVVPNHRFNTLGACGVPTPCPIDVEGICSFLPLRDVGTFPCSLALSLCSSNNDMKFPTNLGTIIS